MLALVGLCRGAESRATLVFAAVTGEENQFLGSDYFVRHLPFPAEAVLADLNFGDDRRLGRNRGRSCDRGVPFDLTKSSSGRPPVSASGTRRAGHGARLFFPVRSIQLRPQMAFRPPGFTRGSFPGRGAEYLPEKTAAYKKTAIIRSAMEIQPDWDFAGTDPDRPLGPGNRRPSRCLARPSAVQTGKLVQKKTAALTADAALR